MVLHTYTELILTTIIIFYRKDISYALLFSLTKMNELKSSWAFNIFPSPDQNEF